MASHSHFLARGSIPKLLFLKLSDPGLKGYFRFSQVHSSLSFVSCVTPPNICVFSHPTSGDSHCHIKVQDIETASFRRLPQTGSGEETSTLYSLLTVGDHPEGLKKQLPINIEPTMVFEKGKRGVGAWNSKTISWTFLVSVNAWPSDSWYEIRIIPRTHIGV